MNGMSIVNNVGIFNKLVLLRIVFAMNSVKVNSASCEYSVMNIL